MEPDKIVTGLRQRKSVDLYKVEDIHVTEKLTVEPVHHVLIQPLSSASSCPSASGMLHCLASGRGCRSCCHCRRPYACRLNHESMPAG